MAHLRKGADGHLLKNAMGHLVNDCEGEWRCYYNPDEDIFQCYSADPGSPWDEYTGPYDSSADCVAACTDQANACNACEPPIPDTFYATFAHLGGPFAWANGTHELSWVGGLRRCTWSSEPHTDDDGHEWHVLVSWTTRNYITHWRADVGKSSNCGIVFVAAYWPGDDWPCTPTRPYSQATALCDDYGCPPGGVAYGCEESINAVCSVSYDDPTA